MVRSYREQSHHEHFGLGSLQAQLAPDGYVDIRDNAGKVKTSFYMSDFTGSPYTDTPLTLVKVDRSGVAGLTGSFGTIGTPPYAHLSNFIPDNLAGSMTAGDPTDLPMIQHAELATTMFARSNPNRPTYSVGSLLQDLLDIPKLLKSVGDHIRDHGTAMGADGIANDALAAKFGWIPLFKDLEDLLRVKIQIARRLDEMSRLRESKGLYRSIRLHSGLSVTPRNNVFVESGFPFSTPLVANFTTTNVVEQWGTVRWFPQDIAFHSASDATVLYEALKVVTGANASGIFASAWDLIPWTWVLNWGINVRDYVLATGNGLPVTTSGCNIMTHVKQTVTIEPVLKPSWLSWSGGSAHTEWKFRSQHAAPSISAHLPVISGDRLSTLALLAVQHLR